LPESPSKRRTRRRPSGIRAAADGRPAEPGEGGSFRQPDRSGRQSTKSRYRDCRAKTKARAMEGLERWKPARRTCGRCLTARYLVDPCAAGLDVGPGSGSTWARPESHRPTQEGTDEVDSTRGPAQLGAFHDHEDSASNKLPNLHESWRAPLTSRTNQPRGKGHGERRAK